MRHSHDASNREKAIKSYPEIPHHIKKKGAKIMASTRVMVINDGSALLQITFEASGIQDSTILPTIPQ
jgi:hypothetical protein